MACESYVKIYFLRELNTYNIWVIQKMFDNQMSLRDEEFLVSQIFICWGKENSLR